MWNDGDLWEDEEDMSFSSVLRRHLEENNKDTNIGNSKIKRKSMKSKPGNAKPSGNGVAKGGNPQSPTDGGSRKVKKGGYKKGGSTKK